MRVTEKNMNSHSGLYGVPTGARRTSGMKRKPLHWPRLKGWPSWKVKRSMSCNRAAPLAIRSLT